MSLLQANLTRDSANPQWTVNESTGGVNGQVLSVAAGVPAYVNQSTIAAGSATKLVTARNINGTPFDGSADVTPPELYAKDEYLEIGTLLVINQLIWLDGTSQLIDVPSTDYEPESDITFFAGSTTLFETDPFILDSPYLADLGANNQTLVWTDAARCPQTISTLLIIGV
jgi:hypothetical protein